jgi:hypothetical protein
MTAPSGTISLAQNNLALSLADCARFRTWCGAANQAGALARIHINGLPKPAGGKKTYSLSEVEAYRPFAIVSCDPRLPIRLDRASFGDHVQYSRSGKLEIELQQNAPDGLSDEPSSDANRQFENFCGELIDQLAELSGKPGYLCFDRLAAEGPYWPHKELIPTEGFFQAYFLHIEWSGL